MMMMLFGTRDCSAPLFRTIRPSFFVSRGGEVFLSKQGKQNGGPVLGLEGGY